jgi:hypothetical protein
VSLATGIWCGIYQADPNLQAAWTRFSGGSNYDFADTSAKFYKPGGIMKGKYLNPRHWQADPGSN